MVKIRHALVASALVAGVLSSGSADAGDITNILRRPVQAINPYVPLIDISQAIPTTRDIMSVPVPSRGGLVRYPFQVVEYGMNVAPTARIVRSNNLLPIIEY
ncbi:MAG: hypothetical protein JNL58_21665 [Planctomyces sp.]|nr:hypothetical protein [Planctomyces sp.]